MSDYDLIIRGGFVVDGTGLPRRRVDVGIRDGKVATLAHLDGKTATEEIDATGLVVAPGIVDAHTHYDPQITFDPYATMSCFHGVTTVVAGTLLTALHDTGADALNIRVTVPGVPPEAVRDQIVAIGDDVLPRIRKELGT